LDKPEDKPMTLQQQVDALLKTYDRRDGPGVVVGVARHGRTLYRAAFGQANVEHGVPMTPATRVSICSVSKHITCAAVLQLAGEGRLALDEPIGRWLPELQPATARPSLRQLMMHTGGVRCHLDVAAFNGVTPHPVGLPMRMMQRQHTVNFEPGDGMMYCNGGYVLLSMAVERASGMPFGRYVEAALFAPLRMDASAAPRTWWPLLPNVATFYIPNEGGGWKHGIGFQEETLGDGNIVSSVDDMLRWAQHLRQSTGPVSLAALTAAPDGTDGFLSGIYRYGLTDERWRGVRLVEHSGGAVGASAHLLMAPDEALDIFVFMNGMEPAPQLARQIAALVLGDRLQPEPPAATVPSSGREALFGQFIDDEQGQIVGFADVGGQLGLSFFGGPAVPFLRAHAPRADELPFHVPTAIGPRYFRLTPDSALPQWLDGGRWRTLRRIQFDPPPLHDMMEALAGADFFSAEAGARLRFSAEGDGLLMHSSGEFGLWNFHARVLTRDLFAFGFYQGSAGWLARLGWAGGRVVRLDMSSTRTRGLVFERVQPAGHTA
jgi:CubicO group peptidase (beta-lactamase class C family)